MTVLDQVRDFVIRRSPAFSCDDCIADKLKLSVRQHANHKTRELERLSCFDRRITKCDLCGREKKSIRLKSSEDRYKGAQKVLESRVSPSATEPKFLPGAGTSDERRAKPLPTLATRSAASAKSQHATWERPEAAGRPKTCVNDIVYLVSCVKTKKRTAAPARELYVSAWFRSARAFVEARSASWFILSAEYGLVEPTSIIRPYENTLKHQPIAQRRQWAATVATRLMAAAPNLNKVVLLAGNAYTEFLVPKLNGAGVEVVRPMLGLRQGEQLRWLKGPQ